MAKSPKNSADPIWITFRKRHAGNPFLEFDPLYALREDVIEHIKHCIPNFFSDVQESFERDLARTAMHGFFLGRPIGGFGESSTAPQRAIPRDFPTQSHRHSTAYLAKLWEKPGMTLGEVLNRLKLSPEFADEVLPRLAPPLRPDWYSDPAKRVTMRNLQDFIAELTQAGAQSRSDRDEAWKEEDSERRVMRLRQEAYAGWLVSNPSYQRELHALRLAGQGMISKGTGLGVRAAFAVTLDKRSSRVKTSRFDNKMAAFCERWNLERLLTWDLPIPRNPEVALESKTQLPRTSEEGITLFVPWYALRGGRFNLQNVAKRMASISAPNHLQEWLSINPHSKASDAGEVTYQRMFWLYRCYFLVLQQRYPSACQQSVEKLDEALASVMGRSGDLIKRIRQTLAKRLRAH
jgi:hypothetical protein